MVVQTHAVSVVPAAKESSGPDWNALIQRVVGGDHQALAEIYDASSHLVFGLALRILSDRDAAEDIVIEVYSQAWRTAAAFEPQRGSVCSWLLTLARSRAIDLLRSHKRERATDPLESAGDVEASTPDPESATADAERFRFVRGAIEKLSAEQREVIELAYFTGLSQSEIAARLGQPLGTVKTRVRLAMMHLRDLLGHLTAPPRAALKE